MQVELARVIRERAGILEQMRLSRVAEEELYAYLHQPGRTAGEMAHATQFGTLHRERIYQLGIKVRQYDKGVELVRNRLVISRGKRKSLETLRDQQYTKWQHEFRRLEQEELDEIATMRAARGLKAVA